MPRQEPVQAAEPFTEFWAKATGTSKIGNRCLTLFLPSSGCPAGAMDELTTIWGNVGDTVFQPAVKSIFDSKAGPASMKRTDKRGFWLVVFEFKLNGQKASKGGVTAVAIELDRIQRVPVSTTSGL